MTRVVFIQIMKNKVISRKEQLCVLNCSFLIPLQRKLNIHLVSMWRDFVVGIDTVICLQYKYFYIDHTYAGNAQNLNYNKTISVKIDRKSVV